MRLNKIHNSTKSFLIVLLTFLLVAYTPDRNKSIKPLNAKKIYKNVTQAYIDFDIISMKSSLKIDIAGKKYNLKANIRIKKDSVIWINLNHSTGYPVARILLTNDSIKVLDKIHKDYYKGDYNSLMKKFNINFSYNTIQGILTNELIAFTKKRKPSKVFEDYFSSIDSNMYVIQNFNDRIIKKQTKKGKNSFMCEKTIINSGTFKISDIIIEDIQGSRKLNISYSDFKELDNFTAKEDSVVNSNLFPEKVSFKLQVDTNFTNFDIKFSKVRINQETKFSFKIPNSYSTEDL